MNYTVSLITFFKGEALANARTFSLPKKKKSPIQYEYMKCRANAQVFSQTPDHGQSKNEIRQMNEKR